MFYIKTAVTFILTLLLAMPAFAGYQPTPESIIAHISVLADDSLQGREVGEAGEWKAAQYILKNFESAGLTPKGTDNYFQEFEFIKAIEIGRSNRLNLNGLKLNIGEDYEPLKQSSSSIFLFDDPLFVDYGISMDSSEGGYDDYEGLDVQGKAVIIKRFAPSSEDNPHVDFSKYSSLVDKISNAIKHGVSGIIFITPEGEDDSLVSERMAYLSSKNIPILFIRQAGLTKAGVDLNRPEIESLYGETELIRTRDNGYNVVGYLPTANDTTIIVGAHYDHLGWGGPTSLYKEKEKAIHNGADDNGSGTAALIELAKYYADRKDKIKYSMLFIAFSGEEAGILGSNHFSKNMTIDSSKVRMMINMDMIGRLKDQEHGLAIFGTGTCAEFKSYFDSLTNSDIKITAREPGTGPSDHTPFYNRGIPALHFFTGAHEDYHRPSDDIDKIDAGGIVSITNLISEVIAHFDQYDGDLLFQKTKGSSGGRRSRYSVSLGVMPDYIAEVKGLKVDGVTPDKAAEAAGIIEGDIIIKMGEFPIGDIYEYMAALGKFRKGDSCLVMIQRGDKTISTTVIFK